MEKELPKHFDGKEAIKHVTENYAKGVIASSEIHGTEIPGAISAGADAAKETAIIFLIMWCILTALNIPKLTLLLSLFSLGCGWIFWKTARSAFLGWARLERLHRIAAQEKWEIEHNRAQEREELTALYQAKGFEGKLLTDVIDVLMSDGDLLLRVMLEEELGLSLEVHEHPLKQAFGAFLGAILSFTAFALSFYFFPNSGPLLSSVIIFTISSYIAAKYEQNEPLPAIIWNVGILNVTFGILYFLMQYFT
jgi:hypothetical protein